MTRDSVLEVGGIKFASEIFESLLGYTEVGSAYSTHLDESEVQESLSSISQRIVRKPVVSPLPVVQQVIKPVFNVPMQWSWSHPGWVQVLKRLEDDIVFFVHPMHPFPPSHSGANPHLTALNLSDIRAFSRIFGTCFTDIWETFNRLLLIGAYHGSTSRTRRSWMGPSEWCGPGVGAPVRVGFLNRQKAMLSNDSRGLENSARLVESTENTYSCPRCGETVESVSATAPATHELNCGCEATISTRAAVEVPEVQLITDGGTPGDCPNCGHELHKTGNPTPGNSPEYKCRECGWLNWHGRPSHTAPPYDDDLCTDGGTDQETDGDALEAEAGALVEAFNDASPVHAPDIEWFGMSLDHETEEQQFVLQAARYLDPDGLEALQDLGRTIEYIEGYEFDGEVRVQIAVPVQGETPEVASTEPDQGDLVTDGGTPEEPTKWEEWSLLEVEFDCLKRTAKSRFMEEWEEREDWKNFEARYHVYKAHDQLSVASYHARQDDSERLTQVNLADCLNHILMAMATIEIDRDECQPITSENDLVTDGGTESSETERPPFVDPNAEYAVCHFCGQTWEPTAVDGFDLSGEDEYYPKMVPVCPEHAEGCR